MKKYIIYIGILIFGMLLGQLIFGDSTIPDESHKHDSTLGENQLWTCSMHPQIMQPEPGDCPICGMDLIPAETSAEGLDVNEFKMSENALALANIETSIIGSEILSGTDLVLSGKIKENEKTNSIQTAHFGGRIEKLFVNSTGEKVNKGQLLASIYSPELVTTQKELLTALQTKNSDPSIYKAVRNKLKLWKLSKKQIETLENSKEVISEFPIYANVAGVVTMKMIDEGNYVKEGQGLFMISNLNTVWADFDAYEKQIPLIKKGDEIIIRSNSNPNKDIKATISFIDPILNTSTRTVIIRAVLNNYKGELKPGMFVQGAIKSSNSFNPNAVNVVVPKTAVLWTGTRSVVYVRKQGVEPIFEMRNVTLGNEINNSYEILEGLDVNEEIVTNGTFTVDAAAQLQGKKSMMNPTGGKVMTGHENHTGMPEIDSSKEDEITTERIHVSGKFQEQLRNVFESYLSVKDALVNDNSSEAQKSATALIETLDNVDMNLLTDKKSHNLWMPLLNELNKASLEISKTKDIKNQRTHFITLSNNFSKALEIFGINKKIYKQYCPMANNDKGAIWLSSEEKIMNPYFGAEMLQCGNIETTIE